MILLHVKRVIVTPAVYPRLLMPLPTIIRVNMCKAHIESNVYTMYCTAALLYHYQRVELQLSIY